MPYRSDISKQVHPFPRTVLDHRGRFRVIEEWASEKLGQPADQAGVAEIRAKLPKLGGLRYQPKASRSPLLGRIDPHLRHVEEIEALERITRAERFVNAVAPPQPDKDPSPHHEPAKGTDAVELRPRRPFGRG